MCTPGRGNGYNHANPLRLESAAEAHRIDERIAAAWRGHPRRIEIPASPRFLDKAALVLEVIRKEIPACCRTVESGGAESSGSRPPVRALKEEST